MMMMMSIGICYSSACLLVPPKFMVTAAVVHIQRLNRAADVQQPHPAQQQIPTQMSTVQTLHSTEFL
jgi:hypothetical protein